MNRYQNKNVFVTGAGGFIASHLVEALLSEGANVAALCRYTSHGSTGYLPPHARLRIVHGDIRDFGFIHDTICDSESEIIFHLAALIGIPYSYHAPRSYFDVNVGGAMNVLEAARLFINRPRVIITSTSEVYGTALYTPIDEDHPLQAQSPYAASKIAADKLAESYHKTFNQEIVTVRPFNTYGPRQSTRAVIPTLITQMLRGGDVHVGLLDTVRDMVYVRDTVEAFMRCGVADNVVGKTINFGTGTGRSIGFIANLLAQLTGWKGDFVSEPSRVRPAASEVRELICDTSLAHTLLNWKIQYPLFIGLQHTVEYFKFEQFKSKGNASSSEYAI